MLDECSNKYVSYRILSKSSFLRSKASTYSPIAQEIPNSNKVIVSLVSKSTQNGFASRRLLPEYGHLILQASKVILLRAIYFICSHVCPTRAQILYCDTDSIHLAMSSDSLRLNQ